VSNKEASRPIGIFDSGMGGLTVLRALAAKLPHESFIYLGDTARLPYGTKSADTVVRYAVQAAGALIRRDVKLIVVACNTASAVALPALEDALSPIPVIGVVEPGAEAAVAVAGGGTIAVIGTDATVKGGAYVRAIHVHAARAEVVQQACPLFVPLAEEGLIDGEIAELVAERYLKPVFATAKPKALVLGCTHFPVLAPMLEKVIARLGGDAKLVDSAATTAEAVADRLARDGLAQAPSVQPSYAFLSTDAPERFARVGQIFLGRSPDDIELIDLAQ
jgi:glutamate racemase